MSQAIPIPQKSSKTKSSPSSPTSSSLSSSASSTSSASSPQHMGQQRRPSLLSSSLSHQEHVVFDLGSRDGSHRIVTCVKTGQGFDWNQEMFLPPLSGIPIPSLNDRYDPVHEIVLSEEEYNDMLPS